MKKLCTLLKRNIGPKRLHRFGSHFNGSFRKACKIICRTVPNRMYSGDEDVKKAKKYGFVVYVMRVFGFVYSVFLTLWPPCVQLFKKNLLNLV